MESRGKILSRLRAVANQGSSSQPRRPRDDEIYADCPSRREPLLTRFRKELEALRGEVYTAGDVDGAAGRISRLLDSAGEGPAIAHADPLVESVLRARPDLAARLDGQDRLGVDSTEFSGYAAGISAADFLVARTGSVVLRNSHAGGRRLSILPPLHIVLARSSQLVSSLDESLGSIARKGDWSYATVVTGPSRTADIEKILVLGAHGPKRLAVVLIVDGEDS